MIGSLPRTRAILRWAVILGPMAVAVASVSIFLGMELFGAGNAIYIAAACIVAWRSSGSSSIYTA